jgi:hypothetical protein
MKIIYKTKPTFFYTILTVIVLSLTLLIKGYEFVNIYLIFCLLFIPLVMMVDFRIFKFYDDRIEIFYPFRPLLRKKYILKEKVKLLEFINIKAPLQISQFFIHYTGNNKLNKTRKISFHIPFRKNVNLLLNAYSILKEKGWNVTIIDEVK